MCRLSGYPPPQWRANQSFQICPAKPRNFFAATVLISNPFVDETYFPICHFFPGVTMRALFAMFSFTLLATPAIFAQDNPDRREVSPRERVNRQFDAGAPKLGDSLPDIAGLTEDGQEIRLSSLKGQHTVLVFGCLT